MKLINYILTVIYILSLTACTRDKVDTTPDPLSAKDIINASCGSNTRQKLMAFSQYIIHKLSPPINPAHEYNRR